MNCKNCGHEIIQTATVVKDGAPVEEFKHSSNVPCSKPEYDFANDPAGLVVI